MRDLIWRARYRDGSELKEFELHGIKFKENPFSRIKQAHLVHFALIGSSLTIGFDTQTGIFEINGRRIFVRLALSDITYDFMNRRGTPYNDIIQYKEAYSDYDPKTSREVRKGITSFNIGYKVSLRDPVRGRIFYFKPIITVPSDQGEPITAMFWITPSFDLKGKLQVVYGDSMREFPGEIKAMRKSALKVEL